MIASPNELIYFLELAKILNFSRASERIGISQPSLSAAIKRLEYSLGAELFLRDKHKVILTQAGKNLVLHAKNLLQLWDATKSTCLASQHEVQGRIVLGAHPTIAITLLPKFIANLFSTYPQLEIQLKHDLSRKIMEEVINLSIDIGIVVNPIKHPDLVITHLFDDEITGWQSTKSNETAIKTIICDPELIQTQWILKRLNKKGFKYKRMITSNNLEVIASLTATGVGIGILPGNVINTNYRNKLSRVPGLPVYHDEICLVYRHENRSIKSLQVIISDIKNSVKLLS